MRTAGIVLAALILLLAVLGGVHARDGDWSNSPASIRQWFQTLMQPDNPQVSCCGEADAFEADNFEIEGDHYVAIITDGKGIIPNGTHIPVPNQKMKWDRGNPTGHGILFIGPSTVFSDGRSAPRSVVLGQIYCYVAPGGV